jgi:hypothetical protein
MRCRKFLARAALLSAFTAAAPSAIAQPAADPAAQAEAAERQRQQDATPDTPGTRRYAAIKELDSALPDHVIYRPANLAALGTTKLGVYAFGNGGCTDDGASARLHLLEIASHGYLAIAPGRIYNGPGKAQRAPRAPVTDPATAPALTRATQLQESIDWALKENARHGSRYFGLVDPRAIAISGFSCGGIQALLNAKDPRVATAVIMNSGFFKDGPTRMAGIEASKAVLADLHFPTLYILGGPRDIAYANGMDDFARIDHVPVAVANIDKGHGGTYWEPNGGAAARVVVRWLDWHLRRDQKAAATFTGAECALCADPAWTFEKKRLEPLR